MRGWTVTLVVLFALTWGSMPLRNNVFPLDDSYIHLVYARNLARHAEVAFNPGEPSLGTSSPLWVALVAPALKVGLDPWWTVVLASMLLHGLVAALAFGLARRGSQAAGLSESTATAAGGAAALFLLLDGNVLWWAASGMETMLVLFLALAAITRFDLDGFDGGTGLLTALLVLARLPALTLGLVLAALHGGLRGRVPARGLAALALGVACHLGLSWSLTGDLLPTTARGKLLTYVGGGLGRRDVPVGLVLNSQAAVQATKSGLLQILRDGEGNPSLRFNPWLMTEWQLNARLRSLPDIDERAIPDLVAGWRFSERFPVWWYLRTALAYQRYVPYRLLLLLILGSGLALLARRSGRALPLVLRDVIRRQPGLTALSVWAVVHLGLYAVAFRTLLHHARYLAPCVLALVCTGAVAGASLAARLGPRVPAASLALIALAAAASLPYWHHIYALNVDHVARTYVPAAQTVARRTASDARVAAFDIGVLGWIGGRHVTDLGGLVDPAVHPYLLTSRCGDFVHRRHVTHLLYSRNLDVDVFTGLHRSLENGEALLRERPMATFQVPDYAAPTLTHSLRLDLRAVESWHGQTLEGLLAHHKPDTRPLAGSPASLGPGLSLVGWRVDQRDISVIPFYAYSLGVTLRYRLDGPGWEGTSVHLAFFDGATDEPSFVYTHRLFAGRLDDQVLELPRELQETFVRFLPSTRPPGIYRLRIYAGPLPVLYPDRPQAYHRVDAGLVTIRRSPMDPMDHQLRMCR